MDHVEYVYTVGMTEAELDDMLRAGEVGVLALADGDDAYAVPVGYDYDGESLLLRLGDSEDSTKMDYVDATETATFVVYEVGPDHDALGSDFSSWSVLVRGELVEREAFDATAINQRFSSIRIFDEPVDEVEPTVYELTMDEVTGRRTD